MCTKVIECHTLVDGISDTPVDDARLVVDDGRIQAAGPKESVAVPDGAEIVDHSEQTITPGFIDAHVHLNGTRSFSPYERISQDVPYKTAVATTDAKRLLEAGFTTVRDVGSVAALGLRDAIDAGEIPGPRIHAAGRAFSQTAGHVDMHSLPHEWVDEDRTLGVLADGVPECRKKVRQELRRGVDVVKIMTTGGMASEKDTPDHVHYTDEEIRTFTEEAHRLDVPVATHAQGAAGINAAIRNGVDTIEHAIGFDDEGVELATEHGATLVPTLSAIYRLAHDGPEHDLPDYHVRKGKEYVDIHAESIVRAYEADVPIALGTDCNGSYLHPHGENGIEFELLVSQVEMSEMDALKAGTSVAAQALEDDSIGSLEPGKYADMVVLDRNPLEDIEAVRDDVAAVYKGGDRVDSRGPVDA
ncbi:MULTISPECIES: amidohydrolase family protein [Natrialba]|uniref:Amidohydrolase family protein n=1 Tax=Natrialba swarupiae TaxID=2448032 RepID=A0A5D5AL35_9EURY|nr:MULTISPECIES: amidohydrolase family protein [Natrialba]MWV41962.1 amidohydrolase family protein [Natrialba sp. INN-245]TYT61655.1 amidohydrolase family protein [Natrialba swarupiae]